MEEEDVNWYEVLQCSIESTKDEVAKAARTMSRKYHPDKNKEPRAREIFLRIQKAKDFLLDDAKRKEYDDKIKKVQKRKEYDSQRMSGMDAKRKRMKEELEERMAKAQRDAARGDQSDAAQRRRQKADVDALRKEGMARSQASAADAEAKRKRYEEEIAQRKAMAPQSQGDSITQIKVKWRKSQLSHSDDSLYQIFKSYGNIEDVYLLEGKSNAAIITYADSVYASAAVDAFLESDMFRVSLFGEKKRAKMFTHDFSSSNKSTASSIDPTSARHSEFVDDMRRAVERDALLRQATGESRMSAEPKSGQSCAPSNDVFQVNYNSFEDFEAREREVLAQMMKCA